MQPIDRTHTGGAEPVAPPTGESATHDHSDVTAHLPPPSVWPFTTAFGVAMVGLGIVSSYIISYVGIIIMFWGIISWIQELRHERH